jgi:hypothetical protein
VCTSIRNMMSGQRERTCMNTLFALQVMSLLKGKPSSWVSLEYVRDGKVDRVKVQRDSEAEARVWRVLSEYSYAHPEDFEDGDDDEGSSSKGDAVRSVEALKRQLLKRNEDLGLLQVGRE